MIIYPAIDLRAGKVVRLREGDPAQQIVFSDDPVATAQSWIDQGAEWIHMVNLDGAFNSANDNLRILELVTKLPVKVQFAGGVRDLSAIEDARAAGATRLVLGTLVVRNPDLAVQALMTYGPEFIGVGLDSKNGRVATHGWTEVSEYTPIGLGKWLRTKGAVHALYTDVSRDGSLGGPDIAGTVALARATGLKVIASGGVRALADLRQLAENKDVAGAIIGMALYQGRFTLDAALEAARSSA